MLLLCGIMTEVGEVATAVRAKYVYNKPDIPEDDKSSLKHEMADVAIYLYALADKWGINLNDAIKSKISISGIVINESPLIKFKEIGTYCYNKIEIHQNIL